MAIVEIDSIQGTQSQLHIIGGMSVTRNATVHELTKGILNHNAGKAFQEAIDAVLLEVGGLGAACPDVDYPTFLEQVVPDSVLSDRAVRVKLVYKGFENVQYELSTALAQFDSNKDIAGNVISVAYTYPNDYPLDPVRKQGRTIEQGAFISRQIPETTLTVTFVWETNIQAIITFAQTYSGKVNSGAWGTLPGAARTWLCEGVSARSADGGVRYTVRATWRYRPITWDYFICFVNPDDGKPPKDLVANVGYKTVQGHSTASFPTSFPPP